MANSTHTAFRASYKQVNCSSDVIYFGALQRYSSRTRATSRAATLLCFLLISALGSPSHAAAQGGQVGDNVTRSQALPSGQPAAAASQATTAVGQTSPDNLSTYEGQSVTSISVAGRPQAAANEYDAQIAQKAGQPFSSASVTQTIDALKASCKCDNVRVQVEPEADGVRVMFVLDPAVYFGLFQFPGAARFPYSRLVQVANYPVQTPYNPQDVELDRKALLAFFQQQGYFQAQIDAQVNVDEPHQLANVVFATSLNHKAKFGAIDIVDAMPEQTPALIKKLQTLITRAEGGAIRPGHPYHYSNLTRATQILQAMLEKQGRLGAQVKLTGAEYHADTNRADIHFSIEPGPKTTVAIQGAHVFSWTKKALLPVYQGVGADDESLEEGRQALISYFQAKGLFDVRVDANLKQEQKNNAIVYTITKGKKHKVTGVSLDGGTDLTGEDLPSHISVTKGNLFSPGNFSDRLVRASVKNLKAVYASEGFSDAKVTSTVTNKDGNIQVSFHVVEGPRDVVNAITIEGADTFPQSKFAPKGLKLAAGQPYSQSHVQADRANIVAQYLQAGYLNSSFRETANVVSKSDPHRINVVYHIFEGPKVNAGEIITLGRDHVTQRLIDRDVTTIKPGQPLTESDLLIAGSKLYDHTGVFDWAEVDPKRDITTQTKEDVLVKVHESSRNELTYGFGFEVINRGGSIPSGTVTLPNLPPVGLPSNFTTSQTTFYGPRGTAQYTRNNLRGKGESASFTVFAGRLDQRAAAYYIDPSFLWSKWRATSSLSYEKNEENPIFSAQEELGSIQFQRPIFKKNDQLFLRYSFAKTDITRVEIPELVPTQDQHIRLSTLAANLTRDTRDNPMDEHKGVLDSLELDFTSSKLGANVDFAKLTGQAAYYKEGFHHIVFANSLRIGMSQPFSGSFVPLSEEFFTGGGSTLRGFPLDGAGPQRQVLIYGNGCNPYCSIDVPSGGDEQLLINSEARIPLPIKKGLGIVAFYDGGNVFPRVGLHDFTSLYTNNIGVGLRYATPVGPIRIDLGHNLNPVAGVSATQYFITIGQAF